LNEEELLIGRLIYHFLLTTEENSHQIVEYSSPGAGFTGYRTLKYILTAEENSHQKVE
jgi:hypothetical protein